MAQMAKEYGSHPCRFEVMKTGTVCVMENGTNGVMIGRERPVCIKDPCEARVELLADDGTTPRVHQGSVRGPH